MVRGKHSAPARAPSNGRSHGFRLVPRRSVQVAGPEELEDGEAVFQWLIRWAWVRSLRRSLRLEAAGVLAAPAGSGRWRDALPSTSTQSLLAYLLAQACVWRPASMMCRLAAALAVHAYLPLPAPRCLCCSPVDVETFYEAVHEDAPLLVSRPNNRQYFGGLFSKDGEHSLQACCRFGSFGSWTSSC